MTETAKRVIPVLREITPRVLQGAFDALNTRLQDMERANANLQGQITSLQERVRKLESP